MLKGGSNNEDNNHLGFRITEPINRSLIDFSIVSSNHNQHLHSLVENTNTHQIDLIVFLWI